MMTYEQERKIIEKYGLDMYSSSYDRLKKIMKILEELEPKVSIKDVETYNDYYDLKEYEKFVMRQYLNTNK